MSEYATRGGTYDTSSAPSTASRSDAQAPQQTPAEQARDEIVRASREVGEIGRAIESIKQAHADNDPERWHSAREAFDNDVSSAKKDLDRARTHLADAGPDAQQQLAAADAALAQHVAAGATLTDPPKSWKPVAHEAEILGVLGAPVGGAAQAGFAHKEEALKAQLAQLSPAESSRLAARLSKGSKDDPLAVAFSRLTPERRGRILGFLGNASKRAALAVAANQPGASTAGASTPIEGAAPNVPAAPPMFAKGPDGGSSPATIDAQVGHMIDTGEPDLDELASIDGTRRRELARRLETYRPGNGDELGARFSKLDTAKRQQLVAALRDASPMKATVVSGAFSLTKVAAAPAGTVLVSGRVDASVLLPAQRANLAVEATVAASLMIADDTVVLAVQIGADYWSATASVTAFFDQLVGPAGIPQLGAVAQLVRDLPRRTIAANDRARINLWGKAPDESFVVLDLSHILASASRGNLDGLRPVEAHLAFGAAGRVDIFGDKEVKASAAIPGEPLGGWIDIPADASLHAVLGMHGEGGTVAGGVFYESGGHLAFAIKPNAGAKTGVSAHVELAYIAEKLGSLGEHAAGWTKKLLARMQGKASDFLHMLGGKLHFELPEMAGTWFDFDLHLVLPHLFHGGGFNLGALLPTGFHLDLHGLSFGALPKMRFPWLHKTPLGGFGVPWQKLANLLGALGSLPAPRLPQLDFSLHLSGDLSLGLGIDLGAAWPELGDVALGFELDLHQLLAKLGDAGTALLGDLRRAGDFAHKWVHLGADGVLRIYDKPDGTMVGFHLLRLLDGAQPADLVPTELRWNGSAASLEVGSVGTAGPADKSTPKKPSGNAVAQRSIAAPDAVVAGLGLQAGAQVDVELFYDGEHLTVWNEAPSKLYGSHAAVRSMVDTKQVAAAVAKHWPQGKPRATDFTVTLDAALSQDGPRFAIDGKVHGHATWTFEQLLGATDWTALAPSELAIEVDGAGGVEVGKIHPPGDALGGRFDVKAPTLRHALLHEADGEFVWAGVHYGPDLIAVSITKSETEEHEGALAEVHLSFLLHQLERLGKAGKALLEHIASLVHSNGSGDVFGRIAEIASKIGKQLLKLVNGVLKIDLGDYYVEWDLRLQLPHLGLDLSKLVPTGFRLPMPGLPNVGLALRKTLELAGNALGSFHVPSVHLRELIPNVHLGSLLVQFRQVGDLFSVFADLGALFGDGIDLSFGFDLPLDSIVAAARKAGSKLLKTGKDIARHVHFGADGVVRVFDPDRPSGDRIGFDLKQLFVAGASLESLIPSEVHLEAGNVAELSYGDTRVTDADKADAQLGKDGKNWGKVLVPRPKGTPVTQGQFKAPGWLAEHLGVPADANVHASLYVTDKDAIAFASIDKSDRGAELTVHGAALTAIAKKLPMLKLGDHDALNIDTRASMTKGMLVVAVGSTDGTHGHVGWKLERLLSDPSLSNLDPDDIEVDTKQGSVRREHHLDLSGLERRGTVSLAGMEWAAEMLGDAKATQAAVWTSKDLHANVRLALAAETQDPASKPAGIELDVKKDFVAQLEHRVQDFTREVSGAVAAALRSTSGAGSFHGAGAIRPSVTAQGIRLERGTSDAPDYMFATFSWTQLVHLAGGQVAVTTLAPDELRVATKSVSFELDALADVPATVPSDAPAVSTLNPMLKGPLKGVGLVDTDCVQIDTKASRIRDPKTHRMAMVGRIYHVGAQGHVERATQLELDVDVDALIRQFIPGRQWGKAIQDPTADHPTTIGATVGISKDLGNGEGGLDVSVEARHLTHGGDVNTFQLEAGWTLQQLLDALMMGDKASAGSIASALAPKKLQGSFADDTLKLTFGSMIGSHSKYNCAAKNAPGIGALLGTLLEPRVLEQAILNLNIPNKDEFLKGVKNIIHNGGFLPIVGCSLELPGEANAPARFYGIDLALSAKLLLDLLYLIPGAGEIYGFAKGVYMLLKDPHEMLDTYRYAPEILADLAEFGPETFSKLREKGWSGLATALLGSSNVKTKQAIMAIRIAKKLGKDWKKPGDAVPSDLGSIPASYLEWLSTQNVEALRAMPDLDQAMRNAGVEPQNDYSIPSEPIDAKDIQSQIDSLAAGFKSFADTKAKAEISHDPQDEAAVTAASDALRKQTSKLLKAGAKESTVTDTTDKKGTLRPADTADFEVSDVSQLPVPTPEQEQEAEAFFKGDGDGQVLTQPHARYWIQKFAPLTTEQLGELLQIGATVVVTPKGRVSVPLFAEERPFVSTLFAKRTGKKPAAAGTKGTPQDDAKAVAEFRAKSGAARATQAEAAAAMGLGDATSATGKDMGSGLDDGAGKTKGGKGAGNDMHDGKSPSDATTKGAREGGKAASAGPKPKQQREIDDAHLMNVNLPEKIADWNNGEKMMVLNQKYANEVIKGWATDTSLGGTARATKFEIVDQQDVGAEGDAMHQWTVAVTISMPVATGKYDKDGFPELAPAEHVERTTFYYDPRAKKNRQMHTDMELLEASRRLAAKVGYDADKLEGEKLTTSKLSYKIDRVNAKTKLEHGEMATILVTFQDVHGDDLVMLDAKHRPFHIRNRAQTEILFALIPPKANKHQA